MTTVEQDVRVRWDYFLRKDGEPNAVQIRMIDTFRENEWPRIQRDLLQKFHWAVPEGLEPHWVAPGRIVYWAEEIKLDKIFVEDDRGGHYERKEIHQGWKPTSGLPATSASPIAHYLDKGFRLRPPMEGVAVEVFNESAIPPEAPPEPQDTRPVFTCLVHGVNDRRQFRTWDAYLQHCVHYKEAPAEQAPPEVLALAAQFEWYCVLHNIGFKHKRHAARHYAVERRKPGRSFHPAVDDMMTKKQEMT